MVPPKGVLFDRKNFLAEVGPGRTITHCRKKETVYLQGDPCHAIFYVQKGKVKLTVVSRQGKVATVAILAAGDFFGEGCLAGQTMRMETATAITESFILRIEKRAMIRVLQEQHSFSELFVAYLLSRNIRYQEDLVDQLFNSSEKRLARILMLLTHFGKQGKSEAVVPKISQETLAQMVGTTRERVSFFMNRFRKLGLIDYNGQLRVHSSLINVVLHD
ncbi:MAG: Crp/Fnr family transcriptional regulator [Acidobacteria bacterium]|nr:Crp/Fnr family transcriptional regulator [Acidobacteriota bacterium]